MSYFVYIMASDRNGTLYVGVTNDIVRRVYQHRKRITGGFTTKYGVQTLVYLEEHSDISAAIEREKRLKRWRRDWKIELIEAQNPHWEDLYPAIAR